MAEKANIEPANIVPAFEEFADKGTKKIPEITTANTVKLFKKANLFGKKCTSNSVDIAFMAAKTDKQKKTLTCAEFETLIVKMTADYAKDHAGKGTEDMRKAIAGTKNVAVGTKTSTTGGVDKMTDTSKYTGAHKARFDADGKGKGASGREDKSENTGYVGNYKGEGTHATKK